MTESLKKDPKVSIIVPVYAVEVYIRQCAESIFSQTWNNLEIIFVDNESPDSSVDIIRQTLLSFPERSASTFIINEKQPGLGPVRMAGLRKATGDFVIHIDSDDWVEKDFIQKLVERAVEDDADVVYCDYFKEYEGRPDKTKAVHERDINGTGPSAILFALHNGKLQAYMWNKLVKRELYHLDTLVLPIRNMHEDIVFQTQILYNASKVSHIKEALYHYRRKRRGAITGGSWFKTRKASSESLLNLHDSLPKKNSPLDYIEQDLVMRAGWYALSTFNFATLNVHPDAVRFLAGMDYVTGRRVPIIKQRILRAYCRCLLKLR